MDYTIPIRWKRALIILIIVNKYNRLVMKKSVFSLLLGLCILQGGQHAIAQNDDEPIPDYFVELRELIPTLHLELRYFSENNFCLLYTSDAADE